jgi:hypothetical protein
VSSAHPPHSRVYDLPLPSNTGISNASFQEAHKFKTYCMCKWQPSTQQLQPSSNTSLQEARISRHQPIHKHLCYCHQKPVSQTRASRRLANDLHGRSYSRVSVSHSLITVVVKREPPGAPHFVSLPNPPHSRAMIFSYLDKWHLERELPGGSRMIFKADYILEYMSPTYWLQLLSNASLWEARILCHQPIRQHYFCCHQKPASQMRASRRLVNDLCSRSSSRVSVSHLPIAVFIKCEPPGAPHFVLPLNPPHSHAMIFSCLDKWRLKRELPGGSQIIFLSICL